jgi:phosphopentomutase
MIKRIILIVMDSVGVGPLPDADQFNDAGANTLLHIHQQMGKLKIPNLCALGLGKIVALGGKPPAITGCYGKMRERSASKDTTVGHWEIAGIVTTRPFPTYPKGFPQDLIQQFEKRIGTRVLGNAAASGTDIINKLGAEHMASGCPIIYTSADSVFQVAAHQTITPLEKLYEFCRIARKLLTGEHAVGRVIARPFSGPIGRFVRNNAARKDFSLPPPKPNLLDRLQKNGFFVIGIGKIGDIFAHRGLTAEVHTRDNQDGIDKTIEVFLKCRRKSGLIFVNLVDFDMVFGHRRNVAGYAQALESFDRRIPQIRDMLSDEDLLIITADHGCDPTHQIHTDHTREYVPLLVYGKMIKKDIPLGVRTSFADCGQTVADILSAGKLDCGKSFKKDIIND